jgi:hypothetical protein
VDRAEPLVDTSQLDGRTSATCYLTSCYARLLSSGGFAAAVESSGEAGRSTQKACDESRKGAKPPPSYFAM